MGLDGGWVVMIDAQGFLSFGGGRIFFCIEREKGVTARTDWAGRFNGRI